MKDLDKPVTKGEVIEIVEEIVGRVVRELLSDVMQMLSEKFDAIDKRFDAIEARLDRIEARLDKVEAQLDQLADKVDYHTVDIRALQRKTA